MQIRSKQAVRQHEENKASLEQYYQQRQAEIANAEPPIVDLTQVPEGEAPYQFIVNGVTLTAMAGDYYNEDIGFVVAAAELEGDGPWEIVSQ